MTYSSFHRAVVQVLMVVAFCAGQVSGDRGRPKVTSVTILSDRGTLLRGPYGGIDPKYYRMPTRDEVRNLAWSYGFNLIHTYMHFWEHKNPTCLGNLDKLVDMAGSENMYILLTFANGKWQSRYNVDSTKQFWSTMAARYKDRTHVIFETTNEPDGNVPDQAIFYKTIRGVAPSSPICVFGVDKKITDAMIQSAKNLGISFINAVASYHSYHGEMPNPNVPCMCTEMKTYAGAYPGIIKTLESKKVSWSVFCELNGQWGLPGGSWTTTGTFKGDIEAAGVKWVPDFGDWPLSSASTATGRMQDRPEGLPVLRTSSAIGLREGSICIVRGRKSMNLLGQIRCKVVRDSRQYRSGQ